MVKTRRRFLSHCLLTTSTLFGLNAHGIPIDKLRGLSDASYRFHYFKRFINWYSKRFYHFDEKLNHHQKKILDFWINKKAPWGYRPANEVFYENFIVSHHLTSEGVFHGKLGLGLPQWENEGLKLINSHLKSENLPALNQIQREQFFGIIWNLDQGKTKVILKSKGSSLNFVEYTKKGDQTTGKITPQKEIPKKFRGPLLENSILSGFRITDSLKNERWKIRSNSIHIPSLPIGTDQLTTPHLHRFHQMPDLLDLTSPGEIKVYYP